MTFTHTGEYIMSNDPNYTANESYMQSEAFMISNIFIDLDFLKYIDLGRILSNDKLNDQLYMKIISIIQAQGIEERQTNDLKFLLRSIPMVESYLTSDHNDDVIFRIAPSFDKVEEFINGQFIISDRYKVYFGDRTQNHITINISSLPNLSDKLKALLQQEYELIFGTPVSFVNIKDLSLDQMMKFDVYYVGDFPQFNFKCIDMLDAGKMINKYIFCPRLLPILQMKVDPTDIEFINNVFHNIELTMIAASKFKFISPFRCLQRRIE